MNIDIEVLRAVISDLMMQIITLQSALKEEREKHPADPPKLEDEPA